MPIKVDKISKLVRLNLDKVPDNKKERVKKEVGEFIVTEILERVSKGRSPVHGLGPFKILSKDYAKQEKGGDRNPDLDLMGDMLDSLKVKTKKGSSELEVGIFNTKQATKADGHNKHVSRKQIIPKRRFIPVKSQRFDDKIQQGVKRIIKSFESELRNKRPENRGDDTQDETEVVLSQRSIDSFLRSVLGEG